MASRRDPVPVPAAEAFARQDRDARLSQAAVVLSVGAAVAGEPERVDSPAAIGLPSDLSSYRSTAQITVGEAVAPLDVSLDDHLARRGLPATRADLLRRLAEQPDPISAAALVEANLHSENRLVRTAAAVAALDTTGPRDDVLAPGTDPWRCPPSPPASRWRR